MIHSPEVKNITHKWLNLSLDLLLLESNGGNIPVARLCEAYDITEAELTLTLANPEFIKNHEKTKLWLSATNDMNPNIIQSAIMAVNLKEALFTQATSDPSVSFKEKLSFLQEIQKDLPRPKEDAPVASGGPVIQFNLNTNVRGMKEFIGSVVEPMDGEFLEVTDE